MAIKLNIGCGYKKLDGFINLDIAKEVNPDVVCNIENGIPFKDNSVDYIFTDNCLEHINPAKWKFVLSEIARIANDGCILEMWLPFDNISTRTNVDHFRTFNFSSWDQYTTEDNLRDYYSPLRLERLVPKPNKLKRIFYNLFPFMLHNVYFKFRIVKSKKENVGGVKDEQKKVMDNYPGP